MNVVVTGVTGQLGFDVCAELNRRGHSVVPARRPDFDLSRPETIPGAKKYHGKCKCAKTRELMDFRARMP